MTVVVNIPVSGHCNFHLFASGEYDRKSVENFIAMLKLHVELGAFDSDPPPPRDGGQHGS